MTGPEHTAPVAPAPTAPTISRRAVGIGVSRVVAVIACWTVLVVLHVTWLISIPVMVIWIKLGRDVTVGPLRRGLFVVGLLVLTISTVVWGAFLPHPNNNSTSIPMLIIQGIAALLMFQVVWEDFFGEDSDS